MRKYDWRLFVSREYRPGLRDRLRALRRTCIGWKGCSCGIESGVGSMPALHRGVPPSASRAHERWNIDFVFNGRLRDERLNARQFLSIEEARRKIKAWRVNCNLHRPHSALGQLTPREYSRRSGIEY